MLFELTPANESGLLAPYERTLGKCCIDRLNRQTFRVDKNTGAAHVTEKMCTLTG